MYFTVTSDSPFLTFTDSTYKSGFPVQTTEATSEIGERQRALGCCYAFEIAASGYRLTLRKELTDEQFIYIFCLLLTNLNFA